MHYIISWGEVRNLTNEYVKLRVKNVPPLNWNDKYLLPIKTASM